MKFNYKSTNKDGEIVEGEMEAQDKYDLNRILRIQALTLLVAEAEGENKLRDLWKKITSFGTVSTHERIIFARNLASMIDAGLSLSRALGVLKRQAKNKKLKEVIGSIDDSIKSGDTLNGALAKFPKTFSPLFISMVSAGEESGNIVQSLNIVADQMDKAYLLTKKVRGALIYPGVIVSVMMIIGVFMLIFIVPTLTATFSDIGVELPGTTKFIITMSDLFKNNSILLLLGLIVCVTGFIFSLKTVLGKRIFNFVAIHSPLISSLVKQTNAARTARTLSSLLSSGVPYVRSLQITKDVIQNSFYKEILEKAEKQIQLGLPVSNVFIDAEKIYPIFMGEMIAVGEETGELADMLIKVADYFENEVEMKTKNMSTIIEPVLMVFVGAAVGFFAVSMISPMYSLVEQL